MSKSLICTVRYNGKTKLILNFSTKFRLSIRKKWFYKKHIKNFKLKKGINKIRVSSLIIKMSFRIAQLKFINSLKNLYRKFPILMIHKTFTVLIILNWQLKIIVSDKKNMKIINRKARFKLRINTIKSFFYYKRLLYRLPSIKMANK